MNGKFFDLKKEKQDRMINAALKVFAKNGYRHASTDDMVREAAISKGLLFHYFGSKLGLYTFVYDYSVRYMTLELGTVVDPKETDLFELMKQTAGAKLHAMRGYPYMQQFLNRSMQEDMNEALLAIAEKRNMLNETYDNIYKQADSAKLPKGADMGMLRKMLELTADGLMTERFYDASFQPEMLYEEIVSYLDMMKKIVER
ncbi:MAG: TetR/AcrR family transcriptional regulator [Lachnoclostridium sp.]|nr:TetR/AcrR family transcriptional regulator [Lachnospira sp.]MCM1248948.1 TetR/AcrR family transcriptional regulator [Lachnoclostridium sp.]